MSVSSCLVLFMICLSLHFCDCRRLGSAEKKSEVQKFDSAIIKNASNNNTRFDHQHAVDAVPPLPESMKDQKSAGNNRKSIPLDRKIKASEAKRGTEIKKGLSANNNNADQASSRASSISWRVPHEKPNDQKDTELDSDYCPPKTHPPSHN